MYLYIFIAFLQEREKYLQLPTVSVDTDLIDQFQGGHQLDDKHRDDVKSQEPASAEAGLHAAILLHSPSSQTRSLQVRIT